MFEHVKLLTGGVARFAPDFCPSLSFMPDPVRQEALAPFPFVTELEREMKEYVVNNS